MNINSKEIVNHIDKIIESVKNNAKIVFSTKDENTTHYNIVTISDYKFILKCVKKVLVNDYEVIIEKSDKVVVQYKLPFFVGKMLKDKISDKNSTNVDKGFITNMLEKARSFFENKKDDIIDFKDLKNFKK
mgnify:CR=1 FL=1